MIRFVYPNIDENDRFAGCGRYLTTSPDDPVLKHGYELADPNVGNLSKIMTAVSMLAPDSFDTDRNVYEYKDAPLPYLGDSMGLAYLLALIRRSRQTKWDKTGRDIDIWCTGAIDIVDNHPFLKNVFQNLFGGSCTCSGEIKSLYDRQLCRQPTFPGPDSVSADQSREPLTYLRSWPDMIGKGPQADNVLTEITDCY